MPTPSITDTITWSNILSTTIHDYRPQLVDNALLHIPLFGELNRQDNVRKRGGDRIIEPLFTDLMTTGKFIQSGDTFDTSHQNPFTAARWEWKQIVQPIALFMDEIIKNSGPWQQVPIIQGMIEAGERSMWQLLGDKTNGAFSNTGDATTGISGLQAVVSVNPSANTVGGIAGSTTALDGTTFWQNIVGTAISAWNTNGIANIRDASLQCERGNDVVDLHVTTRTAVLRLINALTGTYRFNLPLSLPMGTERVLTTGGSRVDFDGVPVIWDANAPLNEWRGLNMSYLKLYFHEGAEFLTRPFVPQQNSMTVVGAIYAMLELVTNRRKAHFVVQGADAAA